MRFLLAAIWGLIILAGLIGWGSALGRWLRPGRALPWGICGSLGFCFSVVAGGMLGVLHLIVPSIVIGLIAMGLPLLLLRRGLKSIETIDRPSPACSIWIVAVVVGVLTLRFLAAVHETNFQPEDDLPAYLVFPAKMLQTGHFAPDPYSDRRMNGLGGQPWSQALVIAPFDISTINLFDHGIAVLLLVMICWEWLKRIKVDRQFAWLVLLTLALTYPNYVNSASFVTISALLFALFVVLMDRIETSREMILIAVLVAGICSLKTTVFPMVGCILGVHFALRCIATRSLRPLMSAGTTALLSVVFLTPWMMAMRQSSASYLPPLLGRGNSTLPSLVGTMPKQILVAQILLSSTCAVGGVLIILCLRRNPIHRYWATTAAIFPLVTAPIILVISILTGGVGWMRYAQPFIYGWIALPMTAVWIWSGTRIGIQNRFGKIAAIVIALSAMGQSFGWARPHYFHNNAAAEMLCGPPLVITRQCIAVADALQWKSLPDDTQAQRLQAAVPAGAAMLARVDFPYLFNFKRNVIFIADHPGLAYPIPGLPEDPDPRELRAFLLSHNVRYVAYSYADEAGFQHGATDPNQTTYEWNRVVIRRTFGFQDALASLKKSRNILYDDGNTAVIDLVDEHPPDQSLSQVHPFAKPQAATK